MSFDLIEGRLARATPGPWRALPQHDEALPPIEIEEAKSGARVTLAYVETPDDAGLIAHAPADLRLLLDVVGASVRRDETQRVYNETAFTSAGEMTAARDAAYAALDAYDAALAALGECS
jgi:hypothetical protein